MAAIGKFRSGKGSRATIEGVNVRKTDWEADAQGDDLDTTHFESLGFDQGTIGVVSLPWSIKGLFDAGQNDFDDPPGLFPRDDLGLVRLYTNAADNVFFSISNSRVLSGKCASSVRQLVTFEASCKSNGSYSKPTGSA